MSSIVLMGFAEICEVFSRIPGYSCRDISAMEAFFFSFIAVLPAFLLPINNNAGTGIIWIVYLFHVNSGMIALPYFIDVGLRDLYFALFITISYALLSVLSSRIRVTPPIIKVSQISILLLLIVVIGGGLLMLWSFFSIRLEIPSIYDVYGVRADYKETLLRSGNPIAGYLPMLSGFLFAPISIYLTFHFVETKRFILGFVFGFMAVAHSFSVYSVTGFKSVAFLFIATLGFLVLLRKAPRPVYRMCFLVLAVFIVSAFIATIGLSETVFHHWVRRVLLVPGMNLAYYYDIIGFWNLNGMDNAPSRISHIIYRTDGSANSGLIGNGLARGGILGLLINYGFFYGFIVLINSVTRDIPKYVSVSLAFPASYAFSNSSVTTVYLSYGGFFMAIFLLVWSWYLRKEPGTETNTRLSRENNS